jgi:hypothetical protein
MNSADLKIIPDTSVTGDLGEGHIAQLARGMGFLWHPPGRIEGGFDGIIELRDPKTKGLTSDFIAVQSKAVEGRFKNDDGTTFTYNVDARDLAYWLRFPFPVIFVLSRPSSNEAYYVVVQEYFADAEARAKRRITFDRNRDVFGGNPQAMLDVARRDANRRSLAADALLEGPMATLGLSAELERAEKAKERARQQPLAAHWRHAADDWGTLADAIAAKGVPRRLVWPALEERHFALREAGSNEDAARARLELAREKIRLDEPTAWLDLAGLEWLIDPSRLGFELELASAQANWFELGDDALDALRVVVGEATGAQQTREAAALLVEVLSIYGHHDQAYEVARRQRKTKVSLGARLSLELDWLDAAGELGHDVESDWQAVLNDKNLNRIGEARARVLQRRARYLTRRGKTDDAAASFRAAAAVWRGVLGADDQVTEALNSARAASSLTGRRPSPLPFGAGAAAALARGSAQVPAVRGELLTLRGLNYLLEERYPDALRHLMAALALHHREGNLSAARSTQLFLGRAFTAVDEPAAALGFFVRAGADKQAAAIAKQLTYAEAMAALRLRNAPPFELAASFAAACHVRGGLTDEEALEVADAVLAAAAPPPRIFAPDPHSPARRLLAQIAAQLDKRRAKKAARILRDEVTAGGPLKNDATVGLVRLSQKGLADNTGFFLERLLAGEDLPVSIAGYLRRAGPKTQQRVVDAAVAGNFEALIEAARADLPAKWPALREPMRERVNAVIEPADDEPISEVTFIGADMRGFGELARHVEPPLRVRFVDHLIGVVLASEHDQLEKVAAIDAAAEVAPALDADEARRLWTLLLPISEGDFPPSAPGVITSHENPKRARSTVRRDVTPETFRAHALLAVARLVSHLPGKREELARATTAAVESNEAELTHVGLAVARDVDVDVADTRLADLNEHADRAVVQLAAQLRAAQAAAGSERAAR